ncbi:MAG: short-chain fatty acyl-CoA regulator family protein [Pseudomonadota bacterium]
MPRSLAGLRIRERRTALGLTQAELAARAGISPSYLNLIEKNRRSVAGRVLLALARVLDVTPSSLAEGPERALIDGLTAIAGSRGADPAQAEAFVGRFADWARAMVAMEAENRGLRDAVTALSDRLAHDPFLGQSVHSMLSNVTAIRSSTDILTDPEGMEDSQRRRFLGIIDDESERLTTVVQDLIAYFDRADSDPAAAATPEEALDRFLDAHDHQFPEIDANPADPAPPRVLTDDPDLATDAARLLARQHLERYATDAAALPLDRFAAAGAALGYDPMRLSRAFNTAPLAVFRRLATLRRPGIDAPGFAYMQVNAAGHVEMRRPRPGLALPRHARACPLWPLFDSFGRPGLPVARTCLLPDGTGLGVMAIATPTAPPGFGELPRMRAAMLVLPLADAAGRALPALIETGSPRRVGPGCRLCVRPNCTERAEPSVLG